MLVYISVYDDRGIIIECYWIKDGFSIIFEILMVGEVKNVIFDIQDMFLGYINEYKEEVWWNY